MDHAPGRWIAPHPFCWLASLCASSPAQLPECLSVRPYVVLSFVPSYLPVLPASVPVYLHGYACVRVPGMCGPLRVRWIPPFCSVPLLPSECASQPLSCGISTPPMISFRLGSNRCRSNPWPTRNGSTAGPAAATPDTATAAVVGDTVAGRAMAFLDAVALRALQ